MGTVKPHLPAEYRAGIPYGATLHFSFPGSLVHLFDAKTELNLI